MVISFWRFLALIGTRADRCFRESVLSGTRRRWTNARSTFWHDRGHSSSRRSIDVLPKEARESRSLASSVHEGD